MRRIARSAICVEVLLVGACASYQTSLSERETDAIITDLSAQVATERAEAKKAADAKQVTPEKQVPVPALLTLKDALKIAALQNRDIISNREGLILSATRLVGARYDVGPRLTGSVSSVLTGSDRAEEIRTNSGTVSVSDLLPTGATATVTGDASQSHGRGDGLDSSANSAVTARVTQPLLRGAGYDASHEFLTDAERQALYDVRAFELSRQDLALRVQSEFYGLVSQKQVIRNREASLASFEFLKNRSDRLFEMGRVSEVDKFRAAREWLIARNALIDAQQDYDARLDRFKILLGLPTTEKLDVAEQIPEPRKLELDLRHAIDVALLNRLDLMTSRDEVEDSERRVRIAEQELLPDLNVEAVGRRGLVPGARHLDASFEHDTYSLGLALEIPFDRVRERNALRSARISRDRTRRDLTLREDSVILEVRESLRNLRSAEASLTIQIDIVASEEKNKRIAEMRFEAGEIGNRDLTDAITSLADAKDRLVRERANVENARVQLLRDLGVLYLDEEGLWRE